VHIELGDPRPLFATMRDLGLRVGLTHNPETPVDSVLPYLEEIDVLLFMSVHPGFGGQAFIPSVLDKLTTARNLVDERGLAVALEIDGGINRETAPRRPPPAPTSSWPGAPSSMPTTRGGCPADPDGGVAGDRDRVTIRAKVLTVSDGVAAGSRDDKSGTALVARLEDAGYEVAAHEVSGDGRDPVARPSER
jgi:hypothetical protein